MSHRRLDSRESWKNSRRSSNSRVQFVPSDIPRIYTSQLKGSRFNYNRQALDPIPVNGKITNWDKESGYGFVEPEVDLSKLKSATDKVFLHKNDINYDAVQIGDEVSFLLYSDSKGIGAHSCVKKGDEASRGKTDMVEKVVPMAVPNKLLGSLIGRKGQYINELQEKHNIQLSIHKDGDRDPNSLQLVTVTGEESNLQEACKAICDQLTRSNGTKQFNSKMLYLVPSEQVGRFIGKQGAHARRAVEHEPEVSLTISKNSIWFQNTEWQKVILFGPCENVQNCIAPVVTQLCFLFTNIVNDYTTGKKRIVKRDNRDGRRDIRRDTRTRNVPRKTRVAREDVPSKMDRNDAPKASTGEVDNGAESKVNAQ